MVSVLFYIQESPMPMQLKTIQIAKCRSQYKFNPTPDRSIVNDHKYLGNNLQARWLLE